MCFFGCMVYSLIPNSFFFFTLEAWPDFIIPKISLLQSLMLFFFLLWWTNHIATMDMTTLYIPEY